MGSSIEQTQDLFLGCPCIGFCLLWSIGILWYYIILYDIITHLTIQFLFIPRTQRTWETYYSLQVFNKFGTHLNILILARLKAWWIQTQTNCCFYFAQLWVCLYYAASAVSWSLCRQVLKVVHSPFYIQAKDSFWLNQTGNYVLFPSTIMCLYVKLIFRLLWLTWLLGVD